MKVLIIKTSSMGDIVHALPAVSDLAEHHPDCEIHWLCEKKFSEIPALHPAVSKIFTIEFRKWRKNLFKYYHNFYNTIKELRETKYDYIIDCQGLFKSALWSLIAKGRSYGFGFSSIREKGVNFLYSKRINLPKNTNAYKSYQLFFSKIFNYKYSENSTINSLKRHSSQDYCLFIYDTSWESKKWPLENWVKLADELYKRNIKIKIPFYNNYQHDYVHKIKNITKNNNLELISTNNIKAAIDLVKNANFVFSVDTGLGHLANIYNVPNIMIFGPTDSRAFSYNQNINTVLQESSFDCINCYKRECSYKNRTNNLSSCMTKITPEIIIQNYESSSV